MPTRRDLITMTEAELDAFLDEERTLICATNGHDGWPHLMPLSYVVRATGPGRRSELWAWTFAKSQKMKNLERDPRATLQVEAGTRYAELRGAMLSCETEIVRDIDALVALGTEIFARDEGVAPFDLAASTREMVVAQAPKRAGLRFVERRRVTWDHAKLDGTY